MAAEPFWRETRDGLQIAVRLTPRGGRDALDGVETLADGRRVLKARVRAAPTEGEANDALIRLLAQALGLSRSRLSIVSGATARLKTVAVEGAPEALATAAAHLAAS
ncbi:DUF167 family protein [Bosea sp. (in: a-proteobacteria)]|uniref:DUF167 family protein n=1 Tax=Bosea sp. (in: a-proteobacteria) TaxID=1871050 RepID=UPI003B3A8D9B